jgi:hypothetical protein
LFLVKSATGIKTEKGKEEEETGSPQKSLLALTLYDYQYHNLKELLCALEGMRVARGLEMTLYEEIQKN